MRNGWRKLARLTDRQIKSLGEGKYPDGMGLYLNVRSSGTKAWELRIQQFGRRRTYGLGAYPGVSLKDAREKAVSYRRQINQGVDPTVRAMQPMSMTFEDAARAYIEINEKGWRNVKHIAQWKSTLATYAYPVIGAVRVNDITGAMVLRVLEPIWLIKPETARRVMQRIEKVIDFAFVRIGIDRTNPARWKGRLEYALPPTSKLRPVQHFAAAKIADAPHIYEKLQTRESIGALALQFLMLTAARTSEVAGANWSEFDLSLGVWEIPATRMKAAKEHRVPLSAPAIRLLETLRSIRSTGLVFSATEQGVRPMSDATMRSMLRRVSDTDEKLTVHGLRSTFRDWAGETTSHRREVIEAALAHQLKDKSEAAYARGDLFDKRRALMDDWAKFLERSKN